MSSSINDVRAFVQKGETAKAILYYRRDLLHDPANRLKLEDLQEARKLIAVPREEMAPPALDGIQYHVSSFELFIVFALSYVLLSFAVAKYFTSRPQWALPMMMTGIVVSVTSLAMAGLVEYRKDQDWHTDHAVLLKAALLREGNGESYPLVFEMPLPAGTEIVVLRTRGNWVQVQLARGISGWIPIHHHFPLAA